MSPSIVPRPDGVVGDYNAAMLMSHVLLAALNRTVLDLCNGDPVNVADGQMHPGQVLAVRGRVRAGTDVTPSSVLLSTDSAGIRVLVNRTLGLHLNQGYLT
jgi:hypothetical protein